MSKSKGRNMLKCPYCGELTEFLTSEQFYGKDYGCNIYLCRPCDAYITTHGMSKEQKGTIANRELRELRKEIVSHITAIMKTGKIMKHNLSEKLADHLDMKQFLSNSLSIEQCISAIEFLKNFKPDTSVSKYQFNSRGHFCNYCRKILQNKAERYNHNMINPCIWYVWNNQEYMNDFINSLKKIEEQKNINNELKDIVQLYSDKKGYGKK